jgi:D-alanyl-D-alanine carboxypeptidase (penicillin-binding protein 5/6)
VSGPYLDGGRRRRRQRWPLVLLALVAIGIGTELGLHRDRAGRPRAGASDAPALEPQPAAVRPPRIRPLRPVYPRRVPPEAAALMIVHLKRPPRAGLVWDVRTGRSLWAIAPERRLRIASLAKMMTAVLVADHARPAERVRVTKEALAYRGSGIGLLPRGKSVRLETMLYGLLLPSGNDAAIALAQHVSGSQRSFVQAMNARAKRIGLACTRFSSPDGFEDRGAASCAYDLAALAREVLRRPRLRRIVRTRRAVLPFPVKGGKLWLYNNNPLLRLGIRGADGVKTGYTDAAGRCLVATVRRGGRRLGVVLLHSPDPPNQARKLLSAGFAFVGRSSGSP